MDPKYNWETGETQVAIESVEKLIKSFFQAEQLRWTESSSPLDRKVQAAACSCCNNSLSSHEDQNCIRLDPGFKLVRHGKNITHIHAYFQNLEPHRYRPKLTAGNKVLGRPDSSVRVVKRGESRVDPNPVTDEGTPYRDHPLMKEEDWLLYEMVVLCCQAPYLSAPPVPSPYSPVSSPTSPTSPHPFEFSYSPPPRAQIHSPFRSKAFSFGSITTSESVPPANPKDMIGLLMKTYGLTIRIHHIREREIQKKMLSKNNERVLVEDLLTQLYLLNNNCHPYYRIQSFLDKNGYDEWVTAEKENINRLIKVFWHFPLPPCPSAYPSQQFDAHAGYVTLMKRFIRYESANKTIHSVYGDVTPTAPLSPAACRILKEFGLRFGVGALYRKLVYLRYLVNHFECHLWIIQHVAVLVEEIMNLVTLTPEIYVKEEFVMLLHILTMLLRKSKYYLTHVTRLFPENSPPGGVTALITLAELSQDATQFLSAKFPSIFTEVAMRDHVFHEFMDNLVNEPFETMLAGLLKEEVEGRYESFKVIAAYKLEADSYAPPLTPNLLNILIYDIQEEITIYKTYYQIEFAKYVDFVQLSVVTFYKLLMLDVQEMCAHIPCQQDKVDHRMLALAYRLSMLDRDMAKHLSIEMQTWREPLLQLSLVWLDIVGCHLKRLIPVLLEKEAWKPAVVTQENVTMRKSSKGISISSKQNLFTQSWNSAFRKVQSDLTLLAKTSNGMSVSNPRLNSSNLIQSSENPTVEEDNHISIAADKSQLSQSSGVGSFKGDVLVFNATVHNFSSETDDTSIANGGLTRSVRIEDVSFSSDSDSGEDIGEIDRSDEVDTNAADSNDKLELGSDTLNLPGKNSQTGINSGFTRQSEITGQSVKSNEVIISSQTGATTETGKGAGQTGNAGQTGLTSLNEQATQSTQTPKVDVENNQTVSKGKETPLSTDETQSEVITFCKTLVNDLISNLIGYSTDKSEDGQTTPYENVDEAGSELSSDYKAAKSSPTSLGTLKLEESHTQLNDANKSSNISHANDWSEPEGKPLDKNGSMSDVECSITSLSTDTTSIDSKLPVPSTFVHKTYQGCNDCPHKDGKVIPDIEDTSNTPCNVENKSVCNAQTIGEIKHGDEDWNKPGPSGLQIANRHHSKALESHGTSASSVYGSVPSHITSPYETATDGSDETRRSSSHDSTYSSSVESYTESDKKALEKPSTVEKHKPRTEVLPLSSSTVDLLCCINRLTGFTCHLCSILCPSEGPDASADTDVVKRETSRMKIALCEKLIQICKDLVFLYTESLLAVETCGETDRQLMSVLGAEAAQELIDRCLQGEVSGCRINPGTHTRCNTTDSRGKKIEQCKAMSKIKQGATGCEVVSSKMGIRNSDITIISSLLPWLHDRITVTISCNKPLNLHGNGGDCQQFASESYCQNGPSVDTISQESQLECQQQHASEYRFLSQSINDSLDDCCNRLDIASDMQCKLVAYRLNDLFAKILHQLLNLSLPTFDVKKRLQPVIDFLHKRLTSLRRVMLPDNFLAAIKYLWRHIVQDFTQEVELLKERRSDATEQSVLLLNSMAYLMQFFHGFGRGISYDDLINTTEVVTKHIELYTAPSSRLTRLYEWLFDQMLTVNSNQLRNMDEMASSMSGSSHLSRAHAPADQLVQVMRIQLHATSKCFSGADLVEWVKDYVRNNGYDSLGVCIGNSDVETGIELGQYLLERNFLACVTFPSISGHESTIVGKQYPNERPKGTVFMRDDDSRALSSQMRFNNISIGKTNNGSNPNSSRSSIRPDTDASDVNSMCSPSPLGSEDLDTRDLLDSVDIILRQACSTQSLLQFQNSSDAFYSFLNDEEGSGGEFKYKLDFTDRFSIRIRLEQIICVLFTRKRKEQEARQFLKRLPKRFIAQALGYKEPPWCFYI